MAQKVQSPSSAGGGGGSRDKPACQLSLCSQVGLPHLTSLPHPPVSSGVPRAQAVSLKRFLLECTCLTQSFLLSLLTNLSTYAYNRLCEEWDQRIYTSSLGTWKFSETVNFKKWPLSTMAKFPNAHFVPRVHEKVNKKVHCS